MLQQRLPALHHGHYPVDLDIDNADERQRDQNNNDGENSFHSTNYKCGDKKFE
jgi:hypothetical protein